jgi:hypothetical protein
MPQFPAIVTREMTYPHGALAIAPKWRNYMAGMLYGKSMTSRLNIKDLTLIFQWIHQKD